MAIKAGDVLKVNVYGKIREVTILAVRENTALFQFSFGSHSAIGILDEEYISNIGDPRNTVGVRKAGYKSLQSYWLKAILEQHGDWAMPANSAVATYPSPKEILEQRQGKHRLLANRTRHQMADVDDIVAYDENGVILINPIRVTPSMLKIGLTKYVMLMTLIDDIPQDASMNRYLVATNLFKQPSDDAFSVYTKSFSTERDDVEKKTLSGYYHLESMTNGNAPNLDYCIVDAQSIDAVRHFFGDDKRDYLDRNRLLVMLGDIVASGYGLGVVREVESNAASVEIITGPSQGSEHSIDLQHIYHPRLPSVEQICDDAQGLKTGQQVYATTRLYDSLGFHTGTLPIPGIVRATYETYVEVILSGKILYELVHEGVRLPLSHWYTCDDIALEGPVPYAIGQRIKYGKYMGKVASFRSIDGLTYVTSMVTPTNQFHYLKLIDYQYIRRI